MSKVFGGIDGVKEGDIFQNKKDLKDRGVHHDMYKGIAGLQDEGAYSVVLAGEYTDLDNGNEIIYTGEGGKPGKDGFVTEDQMFNSGNKALAKNKNEGLPVRVSRKVDGDHFVYAGLYRVDDYWQNITSLGKAFWQYRLIKLEDGSKARGVEEDKGEYDRKVQRIEALVQRQVRDSRLSKQVKKIYGYKCQICGEALETKAGLYAEGAHIKPLGFPHDGSDALNNILCLCPNHHVLFDNGGITIEDDYTINDISGKRQGHRLLFKGSEHPIDIENIRYHRRLK
ncbi:YDG/SRA domain-containing protein [Thiomicrorhabdus arctica]|uniref:YDG/SRA domain-containing protein n=1 Tax=Thiomicrorhabdus arctica TaxID=131540 RepID=UPI0003654F8C|nr:YDG/SRA domain-containing protein [Thiomicrorhabdus arctica]